MKNIFIITLMVVAFGFMINILFNKYESIKETNEKIEQTKKAQTK